MFATITPYAGEDYRLLERNLDSTDLFVGNLQVVVCDGVDFPSEIKKEQYPKLQIVRIQRRVMDYGDTPRAIGAAMAAGLGADYFHFLDCDNFYYLKSATIIQDVLSKKASADAFAFSRIFVDHSDGSPIDTPSGIATGFFDTGQLIFSIRSFDALFHWVRYPREWSVIDDRCMTMYLQAGRYSIHTSNVPIINYSFKFAKLNKSHVRSLVFKGNKSRRLTGLTYSINVRD